MAKIIDLNAHKQNIPEGDIMTDFFDMLRAVVDGDKAAMEQLRSMLDFIDENGFGPDAMDSPSLAETDETYNSDGKESALTLRRNHIRELHLRIKLNRTDLKIWREIRVPSNLTLTTLGEVLQDAMGWMHGHLYQFRKGDVYFVDHEQLEDSFGFGRFTYKDMDKCTVDDLLTEKGKRVIFEYDFGDSWEHDLWYKGEREYEKGEVPSICYVKGQGACPPEDCGGIWGYEDLLEIMKNKKPTKEERERLEWCFMDDDFDPDECDDEEFSEMMQEWDNRLHGELS